MIDDPAAFQIGSTVYSATRFHADDYTLPLGGVVYDIHDRTDPETGESERCARTVTTYRGRIEYATLPVSDIEPGASRGLIRVDVLKQLVVKLSEDEGRQKEPFLHEDARLALRHALITHGTVSA